MNGRTMRHNAPESVNNKVVLWIDANPQVSLTALCNRKCLWGIERGAFNKNTFTLPY